MTETKITDVEFTNADFMAQQFTNKMLRIQDAGYSEMYEAISELVTPIQLIIDIGALKLTIDMAKLGKVSATLAVHVYNAFMLKHKASAAMLVNWECDDD